MPNQGPLLALDYGKAKTGVAVGHPLTGSAQPLAPLPSKSESQLMEGLEKTVANWKPSQIVVGLPLGRDGKDSPMSETIRAFGQTLAARFPNIEIVFHDERLTSVAAATLHADRRQQGQARARDAKKLDSMAAALILESWMGAQQESA